MDKYKSFFADAKLAGIDRVKKRIKARKPFLDTVYGETPYRRTIKMAGDPRPAIKQSLIILDKCVPILQAIKDKEAK